VWFGHLQSGWDTGAVDTKLYAKGFCNVCADKLRRRWSPSTCLSCPIGFEKALANPLKAQSEPPTHRTPEDKVSLP
jgi:hypothetical protein